jgi:hypothetical protein
MAKNYIDNLSEEARKGMQEKAEQAIWPKVAPLGYRNVAGADGKKIIEPDPESAPIISHLFEWYATGTLSHKEVAQKARAAGLVYRKSGAPVPVSTLHTTLRNRLYMGEFEWNGRVYEGKHQPLVTRDLWERVQSVLDRRHAKNHRSMRHDFATIVSLVSGARSSGACCVRSTVTSKPMSPTWKKAYRFSNWRETRKSSSRSRNRAKNAGASISYFRTVRGRMAQCGRLSANHLIF